MNPEHIRSLWEDYLEAATPSGSTENGAIDLYDIEGMNDAAYALHQCCVDLLVEISALKGGA